MTTKDYAFEKNYDLERLNHAKDLERVFPCSSDDPRDIFVYRDKRNKSTVVVEPGSRRVFISNEDERGIEHTKSLVKTTLNRKLK